MLLVIGRLLKGRAVPQGADGKVVDIVTATIVAGERIAG